MSDPLDAFETFRCFQHNSGKDTDKRLPPRVKARGAHLGERRIGPDTRKDEDPLKAFWTRESYHPSRYGTGKYPVMYSASDRVTSMREVASYIYRTHKESAKKPLDKSKRLGIFPVMVKGRSHDLKGKHLSDPMLVHPSPKMYGHCRAIATKVKKDHELIEAPSARDKNGICYPVFSAIAAEGVPLYEYYDLSLREGDALYEANLKGKTQLIDVHDVYKSVGGK